MTEEEAVEEYRSGAMVKDVADMFGTSYSTMWRILKKHGALRGKSESIKLSISQGRFYKNRKPRSGFKHTEEAKRKMSDAKKGKGRGYRKTSTGYIEITTGENAGRLMHVVLMERKIGRRLYSNECVHHIDHDKENNSIENLELMTRSEHARLHAIENTPKRERDEGGRFK